MEDVIESFDLAEAVEAIRDQLIEAAGRNVGRGISFQVGPIVMEFAVELRREAGGKAEVKAWVLGGGVEGKVAKANIHRVQLTLTPVDAATGHSYEISHPDRGDVAEFFDPAR